MSHTSTFLVIKQIITKYMIIIFKILNKSEWSNVTQKVNDDNNLITEGVSLYIPLHTSLVYFTSLLVTDFVLIICKSVIVVTKDWCQAAVQYMVRTGANLPCNKQKHGSR
jgi:hypothetical protein